jgi:hypothetical protein
VPRTLGWDDDADANTRGFASFSVMSAWHVHEHACFRTMLTRTRAISRTGAGRAADARAGCGTAGARAAG